MDFKNISACQACPLGGTERLSIKLWEVAIFGKLFDEGEIIMAIFALKLPLSLVLYSAFHIVQPRRINMLRKFYTSGLTLMVVAGLALLVGCEGGVTGEAVEHSIENCKTRGGIERLIRVKHAKDVSYKVVCKDGAVINVVDDD